MELFKLLWKNFGSCVRVAGSGSTPYPAPDLLASNGSRVFAIECKSVNSKKVYFDYSELMLLKMFAKGFNAEAWIGVKFDRKGWMFILADKVKQSKGESYLVSYDGLLKDGLKFEEFIGKYRQKRLNL